MSTYNNIKGEYLKRFTSDPVASRVAGGTWASGGGLNTGRYDGASAGTQTANLSFDSFKGSMLDIAAL